MLKNKQSENSHGARKIIGILFMFALPVISFAQNYMFSRGYEHNCIGNDSILGVFLMLLIPIILVSIGVSLFVFWISMLIDAIKHSPDKMKIVWVIVIIFTHLIGAIIYYFVEKRQRNKLKTEHSENTTKNG